MAPKTNWLLDSITRNPEPRPPEIPPRYVGFVVEDLPNTVVRRVTLDYCRAFWQAAPAGKGPLFLGTAETWKTTAAAVITTIVAGVGRVETAWVSVPHYQVDFERNRFDTTLINLIRHWERVPFLVLDDFAVIEPNSHGHTILNAVITTRFDHHRPVCWTGNLALPAGREWAAMADRYGALFARRLESMSSGFVALI